MRTLLTIAILFLTAAPAFAVSQPSDFVDDFAPTIPEPGIISLIGIGALALLIGRRGKK